MTSRIFKSAVGGAIMLACASALAQGPELSASGQPTAWLIHTTPYRIAGYGGAHWGMSVDEVKALIGATWPAALAGLKQETDRVTHTKALGIVVPSLPPGPGRAGISYVFGAQSQRLIAVHLTWVIDGNPNDAQRAPLMAAASALAAELVGYQWPPLATTRGAVPAPGALIVFSGRDEQGAGVEIRLDGMPLDVELAGGTRAHRRAPAGPARLRQSFVASVDRPDVYQIPQGAF